MRNLKFLSEHAFNASRQLVQCRERAADRRRKYENRIFWDRQSCLIENRSALYGRLAVEQLEANENDE